MSKPKKCVAFLGAICFALMSLGSSPAFASDEIEQVEDKVKVELQLSTGKIIEINGDSELSKSPVTPSVEGSGDLSELGGATLDYVIPKELRDAQLDTPPYMDAVIAELEQPGFPMTPNSVIGADTRYQILNPTLAPWIRSPLILYERGGLNYMCSGWLIGTYAVATAAHCLYQSGQYSTNFQVVFGVNGYSAVAACTVDHTSFPPIWASSQHPDDDWGVIKINCNAGAVFGEFGYVIPTVGPGGGGYAVTGYPADKTSSSAGYTMWEDQGPILTVNSKRVFYNMDTFGGQSGGPVWRNETGCGICSSAIHAYGVGGGSASNSGTRITDAVKWSFDIYHAGWVIST